ncbi:MAG: hypothetical protein H6613_10230 [Ignavibacteriales bacterium]|nr:hypothetical protein [Ignavibacteriales bacterium]
MKAITFSEDGKLFMGTSGVGFDPNVLVYLTTDKTLKQWYSEVISGPISNFAWDTGNSLYYIREKSATLQQQIFKINMVMKGAPYFGRD